MPLPDKVAVTSVVPPIVAVPVLVKLAVRTFASKLAMASLLKVEAITFPTIWIVPKLLVIVVPE